MTPDTLRINQIRFEHHLSPEPRKVPAHDCTLRMVKLSDEAWAGLQAIALEFGLKWAETGNVTRLLECIGQGVLVVDYSPDILQGA